MKILNMPLTPQSLGLVVDYVSDKEPFASYRVRPLIRVLRKQLSQQYNLAALDGEKLVGYLGWAICTEASAEAWLNASGPLVHSAPDDVAVAVLTSVISDSKDATRRMIRGARELNKGRVVYFARDYEAGGVEQRRMKVRNA